MLRLPLFGRETRRLDRAVSRVVRQLLRSTLALEQLEDRSVPAAVPTATLAAGTPDPLIGENTQFTVRFDNTSPTDTGYGPYVDLYLPATGADGRTSAPNDGITFVSATNLGGAIQSTTITLTAAGVPHPFARDTNGNPRIITRGSFPATN